jgi:hypothetical protein
MEIITGTTKFHIDEKSAVAIGKFDGIHVGHKKLLKYILEQKKDGLKSVVFTFDPSPEEFFTGHKVRQLYTRQEKRREFKKLGIDVLIEFPLTETTAATDPEDFVRRILVGQLSALVDLISNPVLIRAAASDDAETACVRDSGSDVVISYPRHTALEDRVLDANHFCDLCHERYSFMIC